MIRRAGDHLGASDERSNPLAGQVLKKSFNAYESETTRLTKRLIKRGLGDWSTSAHSRARSSR
jgi:hypothetical protein